MKLHIIEEFEVGDCCFFKDPDERKYMLEEINASTVFAQIESINSDGECIIKILRNDGTYIEAKILQEGLEWYDMLYDIGPQTMESKYGKDVADNFVQRGLLFKAAMRAERLRNTEFKCGDIVFDLDRKAEEWINNYMIGNLHRDTFGIINEIRTDNNGFTVYIIDFGEEMLFNRYSYEIGSINQFPKEDDPWYSEYTFSRRDNNIRDMIEAGCIDEYIKERFERLKDKVDESLIEEIKTEEKNPIINNDDTDYEKAFDDGNIRKIEPTWTGEDPALKDAWRSDIGPQITNSTSEM